MILTMYIQAAEIVLGDSFKRITERGNTRESGVSQENRVEIFTCVGLRPKLLNLNTETVGGLNCYFHLAISSAKVWKAIENCFQYFESREFKVTAYTFSPLQGCSEAMKIDLLEQLSGNIIQAKQLKSLAEFSKRVDKVSNILLA
jgi:hypothetical protein